MTDQPLTCTNCNSDDVYCTRHENVRESGQGFVAMKHLLGERPVTLVVKCGNCGLVATYLKTTIERQMEGN